MSKPVAVILLNWNTPNLTLACVSSFISLNNPDLFDIIIADNGSTDDSLARFKEKFPDLIYIDNQENLGFAAGNNRALQLALDKGYRFSLLLNTDAFVKNDILTPLLAYANLHPEVGMVQPAIYWASQPDKLWNGGGKLNTLLGRTHSSTRPVPFQNQETRPIDWATGCCMLMNNEALRRTGLFNEQYFLYFEDVDLSLRFIENNYPIHYYPHAKVYHIAGASGKKEKTASSEGIIHPMIHYYNARNKIWLLRGHSKSFFLPTAILYNSVYYLAILAYFIIRRRWNKAKFFLKGIKDGLFTEKKKVLNYSE